MDERIINPDILTKELRLKYCYHAEFLDEDKVLLLSAKESTLITGKLYCDLLRHLREDGSTLNNLIARMGSEYSFFRILAGLEKLETDGFITRAASPLPRDESAYWNSIGIHTDDLVNVLEKKPVSVEYLAGFPAGFPRETFERAFTGAGIKIAPESRKAVLRVVVVQDYLQPELAQINREALESQQTWMLFKPQGVQWWTGPIFLPGETGCWECLRQRLSNNRPEDTFFQNQKNTTQLPPYPAAALPLTMQMAAGMTALEIVKWLCPGEKKGLVGNILSFDTHNAAAQWHALVKRPQCHICGEERYKCRQPPVPIVLEKRSNVCATTRGGYREVPLENTVEKYRHHVSPITGVVQWLKPYFPNQDTPVYNYSSGLNLALQSKNLFWLNYHIRGANGGKGRTWSQAKAGALCEAIERYSCTYQGDEYYITGSYKELGSEAIHPNRCMNFSQKQFQNREETNKDCRNFYLLVPRPFDETLKMHWSPVYSLTRHKFKYLPSCFCYAQYPAEDDYQLFAYPDSSGCAAGNSLEEAILQGFLELVERDSVALWWYNMSGKPAVDLASFNDPYFLQVVEYYRSIQRGLYVLDLTSDLQIPAFAAISYRPEDEKQEIIFGFGAHPEAGIAVERAILELNQLLPIVRAPGTDRTAGRYRTKDKNFIHWLDTATLTGHPYLAPLEKSPLKKASDYPQLCSPNIYDSLVFCIDIAAEQGLETLVLDMTRPDIGLNAVKVMVTGLRHFWKRLAPGRLYDVPVKMGWLRQPLEEEELNPIGLFI